MKTYKEIADASLAKASEIKKTRNKWLKMTCGALSAVMVAVGVTVAVLMMNRSEPPIPAGDIITDSEASVEFLTASKSYDSIYRKLNHKSLYELLFGTNSGSLDGGYGIMTDDIIFEKEENFDRGDDYSAQAPESESTGTNQYSGTNVQVAGIDEADVVKCDGKYIYSLCYNSFCITEVNSENGDFSIASKVDLTERLKNGNYGDMYVSGDRLLIIGNDWRTYNESGMSGRDETKVIFYDISDRANPKYMDTLVISGSTSESRLKDGKLYIVSTDYIYDDIKREDPTTYVPYVGDCPVEAEDVYYDDFIFKDSVATYLNVICVNINDMKAEDSLSLMGYGYASIYQSHDNLYCFQSKGNNTKIIRISTEDGITLKAEGEVEGYLLNSYSMDEYNGNLRVVTTDWNGNNQVNGIYIFDGEMKCIGKIDELAKDERVYSCRFDGDVAYFVTFREMDPLFCVDLSVPTAPKILSELKIPGFSEYLHKYSDNLLFGLGRSATETSSGWVKLSMFDISDKTNVTEVATLELTGISYTEAAYDFHAVLVDGKKGLIGFASDSHYFLFTYKDGKFVKLAEFDKSLNYSFHPTRGIYIGDYFFVCERTYINSYSLENFEWIAGCELEEYEPEIYLENEYVLID